MNNSDKIKKRIAETTSELDEEYYSLGKKIYEIMDKETDKINELVDKLIDYRIKLHDFSEIIICGNCDMENVFTNNYCHKCGSRLMIK